MFAKHQLFAGISLGVAMLSATSVSAQVAAPAGAVVAAAGMEADATTLDAIKVLPQLMAQERAIDLKRESDAILDAVSSDAMGNYPDKNVAESLQRLPGVSVTRDQGEGRFVVVRGLDAALNTVTVDGLAIGTTETGSRAAPMDLIPSESTERLKVVKSPTPDMPGDSIGGAIQVESASAFDRDGRAIRAKIEGSRQQLSGENSPKASINYSDLFAGGTFGVAAGVNYSDRTFESDNTEGEYDDAADNGDMVMVEQQRRKYYIERERLGANLNLDWRPDADNKYYLHALYSRFDDAETRQSTVLALDTDSIVANGDGSYDAEFDKITKRVRNRTKKQDTLATSFGGENRLDGAVVDYQVGYTKTRERAQDELEGRFQYAGDDLTAKVDQNRRMPAFGLSGSDWMEVGNYEFDRFVRSPGETIDKERSAGVNVRFDGDNASYKFGLLGRFRDRDVDVDEVEYRVGPEVDLASWALPAPEHRGNTLGPALSASAMRAYWNQNGGRYSVRPGDLVDTQVTLLAQDYTANEDILSAYAMGTWNLSPALRVIAGVRVETTRFDATGSQLDLADDGLSVSVREVNNNYTNVLPGLHVRWDGGSGWALRGAINKTVSRPGFGQISPNATLNTSDGEVELGNPNLDPYESTNLDVSFEKYIGDNGILSLGLFGKSIDGYITDVTVNNDPQYVGYDVSTAINGKKAKVYGAEFNWQQQLNFLPGNWSGLLAGVSGTLLDTKFDPDLDGREGDDFDLPRASRHIYTAFLGYEKNGFSTRLSAVHRSEYLDEIGKAGNYDIYVAPNTQLDFSLNYQVTSDVQIYFDAGNLLDEPLERYQGDRSHTQQMEEYGRTYAIGLRVNL